METAAIIISAILAVILCVGIILISKYSNDHNPCQACATMGILLGLCVVIFALALSEYISPSITPMDVYRGKTTLEITYKDGVPTDSIVVFKD